MDVLSNNLSVSTRKSANHQIRDLPQFSAYKAKQKTCFTHGWSWELIENQKRSANAKTVMHYKHTHMHTLIKIDVFSLGGGELPERDDNESEEDRCSQEDCYNYGCDGPRPHSPFLFIEDLCGILIVKGEGQL